MKTLLTLLVMVGLLAGPLVGASSNQPVPSKARSTTPNTDDRLYTTKAIVAAMIASLAGEGATDGQLLTGSGVPSDAAGKNGDGFLRTDTGGVYIKAGGAWGSAQATLQLSNAHLDDLADGTLTGSKVGTGVSGDNVTSGTVADARIASTLTRDSEAAAAYQAIDAQLTSLGALIYSGNGGKGVRLNAGATDFEFADFQALNANLTALGLITVNADAAAFLAETPGTDGSYWWDGDSWEVVTTTETGRAAMAAAAAAGSGDLVFATSPTLVAPNIGAASGSSLTLTGTLAATTVREAWTDLAGGTALTGGVNYFDTFTGNRTLTFTWASPNAGDVVRLAAFVTSDTTLMVPSSQGIGATVADTTVFLPPGFQVLTFEYIGGVITRADSGGGVNNIAASDPGVTNDLDEGYQPGSLWYNSASGAILWCEDASNGAAVWNSISSTLSDTAYNAGTWDAVTTVAPSKNAVRDYLETLAPSGVTAVTAGGTGRATSTTAYGLLAAGTTATGAHQTLALGATTEVLVGGGAGALPVWTTASGTGAPLRQGSPTITTPRLADLGFLADANGNELLVGDTVTSAVNELLLANAATGANPRFTAQGGDADVGFDFLVKGAGVYRWLGSASGPAQFRFFEDADNGSNYVSLFSASALASNFVLTLPSATDTLVGKATADTFTNKTFDTAGSGNSFSINGTAVTANTGTGAVARADSPAFTTKINVPNAATDATLSTAGDLQVNTTDEQIGVHSAADGEISGEAALSFIKHFAISFDPKAVCDGAVDRLFLMQVGDDAPEGITIDEWKVSFEADPTTEVDLDFKRATAFIGVGSAAVMDVLDTTAGVATEDTDANINAGAVVANGQVLYLEFGTAYTETTHQVVFEFWYHAEED